MGWSIGVAIVNLYRCECLEIGCPFNVIPMRTTMAEAQADVAEHRRWHDEQWDEMQHDWDLPGERNE